MKPGIKLLMTATLMTGAGLLAGCVAQPGYGYGGYSAYRAPAYEGYYESAPYDSYAPYGAYESGGYGGGVTLDYSSRDHGDRGNWRGPDDRRDDRQAKWRPARQWRATVR